MKIREEDVQIIGAHIGVDDPIKASALAEILVKKNRKQSTGEIIPYSIEELVFAEVKKAIRESGFNGIRQYRLNAFMRPGFALIQYRYGKHEDLIYIISKEQESTLGSLINQKELDHPYQICVVDCPITPFTKCLIKSICGRAPISLIINRHGDVNIVDDRTPEGINPKWGTVLRISIYDIMNKLFLSKRFGETIYQTKQINRAEMQLLRLLREPGLECLNIVMTANKKIKHFEKTTRIKNINEEVIKELENDRRNRVNRGMDNGKPMVTVTRTIKPIY